MNIKTLPIALLLITIGTAMHAQQEQETDSITLLYAQTSAQAMQKLKHDSLPQAEQLLIQAINIKPAEISNQVLWRYIGEIRLRSNQPQTALQAFNQGLSINPGNFDLLLDRASLSLQTGNQAQALSDLDIILLHQPDNTQALFYRAYLRHQAHLYPGSRQDYEHLLTLQPRHKAARMGLALLNNDDRRPVQAMEHLDVILRYWPDDADALALRAGLYTQRREYELALRDYNRAIQLQPRQANLYISRATLYLQTKRTTLGRQDLRTAVSLGADPQECASLLLAPKEKKARKKKN